MGFLMPIAYSLYVIFAMIIALLTEGKILMQVNFLNVWEPIFLSGKLLIIAY